MPPLHGRETGIIQTGLTGSGLRNASQPLEARCRAVMDGDEVVTKLLSITTCQQMTGGYNFLSLALIISKLNPHK